MAFGEIVWSRSPFLFLASFDSSSPFDAVHGFHQGRVDFVLLHNLRVLARTDYDVMMRTGLVIRKLAARANRA